MKQLRCLIILYLSVIGSTFAAGDCGSLKNGYGPYDYTNPNHKRHKLPVVERHHFNSDVESLTRGISSYIHGDLDYTLRAFPNHHRALHAMARYQLLNRRPPNASYYTADCYFQRAIRFRPKDAMVRMIYGIYLHRLGKKKEALKSYRLAEQLNPASTEIKYNMGLLFLDMKKFDDAVAYAEKAYRRGYPLPGLRDRLRRKGLWKSVKKTNGK